MLPPPPRLDTVVATDSATHITLVSAQPGAGISVMGLPVIPGYEVIDQLGRGGMGRVYKARHLKLDRLDAIKMVAVGADDTVVMRLVEEAKAIAKLKHPNIAQVYDSGEVGGQPFYAMELLDGGTLSEKLGGKPIPAREAAELVMTLARAVEYFHQQEILHRDLKPSNVLLTKKGEPRIADFGLVKHLSGTSSQTQTGDIMGSPSYMAPEQASGQVKTLGPAVDIYALGAILYECLTGRPPFQTPEPMQTLMMVITLEPIPPSQLVAKLPRDINTICMKCLEKQPGKRYARAEDLAEELRRFLAGEPIVARPVGRVEKAVKWCKRRPAWAALIVAGLVTLVVLGLGYWKLSVTNRELEEAKKETDLHLKGMKALLNRTVIRLSDLDAIPHTEAFRLKELEDASNYYRKLLNAKPNDIASRAGYVENCLQLANIERLMGRLEQADELYERAYEELSRIIRLSSSQEHQSRYVSLLMIRANLELDRQRMETRQRYIELAAPVAQQLAASQFPDPDSLKSLSLYHTALGQNLRIKQQFPEAEREYRIALQYQKDAQQCDITDVHVQEGLAMAHSTLGSVLLYQKKFKEAEAEQQLAIDQLPAGTHPRLASLRAMLYSNHAVTLEELKRGPEAEAAYRKVIAVFKKLTGDFPLLPDYRHRWVKAKLNLTRSLIMSEPRKAPAELLEVKPVLDQLIKDYPQQANYRAELKVWQSCKDILEIDFKIPVKVDGP